MRLFAVTWFTLVLATSLVAQQNGASVNPAPPSTPVAGQSSSQPATNAPQSSANDQTTPQPQEETGAAPPPAPLGTPILPNVTKKQAEEAKKQFQAGVKLKEKGHLDEAFTKFTSASELDPTKLDYVTAREFTRQQLAYEALQRGNKAMLENNDIVAMAEFRRALEYDATNTFAMHRLRDAIPETDTPTRPVSIVEQSAPIELQPTRDHHDFNFRGDARAL